MHVGGLESKRSTRRPARWPTALRSSRKRTATGRALAQLKQQPAEGIELTEIDTGPVSAGYHDGHDKAFIDLQNDVIRTDLELAVDEGYDHVELAKRYTTLGMGTDQGKTSWGNAILEISRLTGASPADTGHTTFRPPWSPVSLGALVGADVGRHMTPLRHTPFHRVFKDAGCVFQTSGDWLYSRYFPRQDESMSDTIKREVLAVRNSVGCVDMSTLGKVDVKGADALEFLGSYSSANPADQCVGAKRSLRCLLGQYTVLLWWDDIADIRLLVDRSYAQSFYDYLASLMARWSRQPL
ncbi:MAG: hypothetical protein GY815_10800 [Gammaproteobacteria bacterium]|nr:hypothetical protein [Gammaproteobacteria bacterium]